MNNKYFYIDDENELSGIIAGLCNDLLEVEYRSPNKNWNDEISFYETNHSNIRGIILDLRLEDGADNIEYKGSTLAQEIRTRQKENKISPFPIVLFSANDKLVTSLDKTAKDLFDYCQEKGELDSPQKIQTFRDVLICLSNGYNDLNKLEVKTINTILKIDVENIYDPRFINTFKEQLKLPIHSIAKFIISELLEKQGLLISERVLSSRLGVDLEQSADWERLKDLLKSTKYDGVFSDYSARWWMPLVEQWWDEKHPNEYLRSINASQRVQLLKEQTELNLVAIKKTEKNTSSSFWTVCKGTGIPIDTTDGLIIANQEQLYPWQEKEYISICEAIEESNKKEWKAIAASEKNKFDKLKDIYQNEIRVRK